MTDKKKPNLIVTILFVILMGLIGFAGAVMEWGFWS